MLAHHCSLGGCCIVLDPAVQDVSSHLFPDLNPLLNFSRCFWLQFVDWNEILREEGASKREEKGDPGTQKWSADDWKQRKSFCTWCGQSHVGLLCPVACRAVFCSVLQNLSFLSFLFFFHFTYKAGCLEFVFWPSPVESSYMHGPTRVFFPLELMSCTWMTQTKTVEVK